MKDNQYKEFLDRAPDHNSHEFIVFLRENNTIVVESEDWLIVENLKYHSTELPWYTAFHKREQELLGYSVRNLEILMPNYRYMFHPVSNRTVDRFHIHLLDAGLEYILKI